MAKSFIPKLLSLSYLGGTLASFSLGSCSQSPSQQPAKTYVVASSPLESNVAGNTVPKEITPLVTTSPLTEDNTNPFYTDTDIGYEFYSPLDDGTYMYRLDKFIAGTKKTDGLIDKMRDGTYANFTFFEDPGSLPVMPGIEFEEGHQPFTPELNQFRLVKHPIFYQHAKSE